MQSKRSRRARRNASESSGSIVSQTIHIVTTQEAVRVSINAYVCVCLRPLFAHQSIQLPNHCHRTSGACKQHAAGPASYRPRPKGDCPAAAPHFLHFVPEANLSTPDTDSASSCPCVLLAQARVRPATIVPGATLIVTRHRSCLAELCCADLAMVHLQARART